MQNSGLPERGDSVVCFTDEWLRTEETYAQAMQVASLADAYRRRDRGVEGFLQLRAAFEVTAEIGCNALRRFYQQAEQRTQKHRATWENIVQQGTITDGQNTLNQLQALQNHDIAYLLQTQHQLIAVGEKSTPGFCGHLNRYFDPVTLAPEGIRQT